MRVASHDLKTCRRSDPENAAEHPTLPRSHQARIAWQGINSVKRCCTVVVTGLVANTVV